MKFSVVSTLENRRENLKLIVVHVAVLFVESNSNNTENTTTPNIVRLQNRAINVNHDSTEISALALLVKKVQ